MWDTLGVFAAKEERDGCICIWRGWNRWSSDSPHSGGPEIPVYDVIMEFFLGLTDVLLTQVINRFVFDGENNSSSSIIWRLSDNSSKRSNRGLCGWENLLWIVYIRKQMIHSFPLNFLFFREWYFSPSSSSFSRTIYRMWRSLVYRYHMFTWKLLLPKCKW